MDFECLKVPMEVRVDYLNDNYEDRQELYGFIEQNGGLERGGLGRGRFVLSKKKMGKGSVFISMVFPVYNGWLADLINKRVVNRETYRAYEEGEVLVFCPVSGVTMPAPTNIKTASH